MGVRWVVFSKVGTKGRKLGEMVCFLSFLLCFLRVSFVVVA